MCMSLHGPPCLPCIYSGLLCVTTQSFQAVSMSFLLGFICAVLSFSRRASFVPSPRVHLENSTHPSDLCSHTFRLGYHLCLPQAESSPLFCSLSTFTGLCSSPLHRDQGLHGVGITVDSALCSSAQHCAQHVSAALSQRPVFVVCRNEHAGWPRGKITCPVLYCSLGKVTPSL